MAASTDSTALLWQLQRATGLIKLDRLRGAMAGRLQQVIELSHRLNRFPEERGLPFVNDDFLCDPRTRPIRLMDAILPPLLFFLALTLLFPSPSSNWSSIRLARLMLAIASAYYFFALPYRFHVPGSAILTYQLGLIGWYGGPRVLDLLVISKTVPKRVKHVDGRSESMPPTTSYTERRPRPHPSLGEGIDHASGIKMSAPEETIEETGLKARMVWAFDLLISMRGVGWDFCSTDVRHSTRSWHPPPPDRVYALCLYILPSLIGALSVMKHIYNAIEEMAKQKDVSLVQAMGHSLLWLPAPLRFLGVASCGIALYTLFDASYTVASIVLGYSSYYLRRDLTVESSINNIAAMAPLNPLPATQATSIRAFWSLVWHRLFTRLFTVWGIWPGQYVQKTLARLIGVETRGDFGKVVGAFLVSAVVHGQGERAALGKRSFSIYNHYGVLLPLGGEPAFFLLSAAGILFETAVQSAVVGWRRRRAMSGRAKDAVEPANLERSYDKPVGAIWTVCFLLWSGVWFVEGWVKSGIWAELTGSRLRWNL